MGVGGEYWFGGWLRKAGFSGGLDFMKDCMVFCCDSVSYPAFGDHPDRACGDRGFCRKILSGQHANLLIMTGDHQVFFVGVSGPGLVFDGPAGTRIFQDQF